MSGRLPDIIGIGTRRCGSSWLHAVLNSHPEIGKPPSGLHYFSQHVDSDPDWYARQLAPHADRRLLLEFSVSYLYPEYCVAAAEKIRRETPNARLFLCVRNPVARAYSDYLRSIRMNEVPASMDFSSAVAAYPILLERSSYARLLAPYLEAFPRDRIKVLLYEDLDLNPDAFANDLATFLGVPPDFDPQAVQRAEPKGKTVRSEWLNRAIRSVKGSVDSMVGRMGMADGWSNWKGRYVHWYEQALDLTHRKQDMDQAYALHLASEFSDDIALIETLTGRDLRNWHA